MGQEHDVSKNSLIRLTKKDRSTDIGDVIAGGIVPLRPEQRNEYPHVIYESRNGSTYDRVLLLASYEAMRDAQFPIAVDLEGEGPDAKAIVRTSATELRDKTAESALFLGLTEATRRRIETSTEVGAQIPNIAQFETQAATVAGELLQGLTSNSELYKAFLNHYGRFEWLFDPKEFSKDIFVYGTDFDPELLDQSLTVHDLNRLIDSLDLEIPYSQQRDWYPGPVVEIFKRFPELDYRRLQDEEFRATPEGQTLLKGYKKICGVILADRNTRENDRDITTDGRELPRPQIPLSKHPIIEALVVAELSMDRPKPKYGFGPYDLIGMVIDSDSEPGHQLLVTYLVTRLPQGHGRFDGSDRLEFKGGIINSVLSVYNEACTDDQRRGLLRRDLAKIIDAFTGNGEIAASVREENIAYRKRSKGWNSDGTESDSMDVNKLKEIVGGLIRIGLTSPDPEIVARAEDLIAQYIPANGNELAKQDVLALSRSDLKLVLIDALRGVSVGSQPAVFYRTGARVFGDTVIGDQLQEFAETGKQAIQMRSTTEFYIALTKVRKIGYSTDDNKSAEEVETRRRYDELLRPADLLMKAQREGQNRLLLTLLGQLAESEAVGQSADTAWLFTGLVNRVDFIDYDTDELPSEYHALIDLAKNPGLTPRQRHDILWHMERQFDRIGFKANHLLVPVILDMYNIAFGPADAVGLPPEGTHYSLASVTEIVKKRGHKMFESASQDQLKTLSGYREAIRVHAERIAGVSMLEDGLGLSIAEAEPDMAGKMRNLKDVMRQLQSIGERYERYLRIDPHVYYPYVLEQFIPFWQELKNEVEAGSNGPHIINLRNVLEDIVRNNLVVQRPEEYPEDFDPMEQGHVDSLIFQLYQRIIPRGRVIGYSLAVKKGLSFLGTAIANMPPNLLERIREKYPDTAFAEYLKKEGALKPDIYSV